VFSGGIDKYFKEFPDGGYWKGKNYVFDKRFAHAPPAVTATAASKREASTASSGTTIDGEAFETSDAALKVLGKCECCGNPWDMFRGKRRCPTCGVPSLICKDCWEQESSRDLKHVRCDLCVDQNIRSKRDFQAKEQREIQEYESRLMKRGLLLPGKWNTGQEDANANPGQVTRLYLKNMCKKSMTEGVLMEHIKGITHIVWKLDHRSQAFLGSGWVEMETPEAAALAVAKSGEVVQRRPLYIEYQPPDGKDKWPPPNSTVNL
jgi:Zn finger protein HypA/HybF involved in hydrogenase expression